jgi:crotonobetainyl-CoA:carnitine CoA-transferase CaiB-like acyl-CoA transferase
MGTEHSKMREAPLSRADRGDRVPPGRASQTSEKRLPLAGVRVLDVTLVWAGPHCTQLLAEWGAEVIRVEPLSRIQPSTRGADTRMTKEIIAALPDKGRTGVNHYPDSDPGARSWNRSSAFNSHARNKRSMTLNLDQPEGRAIFDQLVAVSDVFVENNAPETIEALGLTYERLSPLNPGLVQLRMPAYGLSGPYKSYRSFGNHMESMTGHHYLRGYADLDPEATGNSFTADAAGGVLGAFAVLLALRARRRHGRGQMIELALAENFLPYIGELILDYTMNGRVAEPKGNEHASHAPHNAYPCAGEDRWIAIDVGSDEEWAALCRVAGEPAWACDPRFATTLSRWQHRHALDAAIGHWTCTQERYDLFRRLQVAGVIAGPVQDEADAYACPQLNERGFFEELTHPEAGTHRYPGLNVRLTETPNHLRRAAPLLGGDNSYVYCDLLGLADDAYADLEAQGHIGMDYPESAYAPRTVH